MITRSIATQNSCAFSTNIMLDQVTGYCAFGVNGSGLFIFKSGIIYDLLNRPVWSYRQNSNVNISGVLESGVMNYWIDNIPVSLQESVPNYTSGFNYDCSGANLSYSLNVVGSTPNYSIFYNQSVLTGQNISGYIQNLQNDPKLSFRIFSGSIPNSSTSFAALYTGNIAGQSSGAFSISGLTNQGIFNIPIVLNSNFGTINNTLTINISGTP